MTKAYQQYYSWIPDFLHQRPRSVIAHSLQRIKNCEKEKYAESDIQTVDGIDGIFSVRSKSGRLSTVNFGTKSGTPSCTCEDWIAHHLPCKHFYAIFQAKNGWNWDSLPEAYVNSSRLSYDKDVLQSSESSVPIHTTEQVGLLIHGEVASIEESFSLSEPPKQVGYIYTCTCTCT